ncbi:unnamed protein product [Effrenium voratum]|uniref:Folate receptor-like domain-containing protein n=1 Tax=Effrenium voratum TaxID=2562239 RepID=A0AA36I7F9_9DINO|nr:unnamed protein product [Effrenium voratum]
MALLLLALATAEGRVTTTAQNCRRIDHIYASGKDLCERMWGSAFRYEANESQGYTMWFFDASNPNDAVSGEQPPSSCNLQDHKDVPSPEPALFAECHPWRFKSCCSKAKVNSMDALKQSFGAQFHWDRCGPVSQECERFFVQEACFYECDPNVGLYRKYHRGIYDPRCDAKSKAYSPMYAASRLCSHNTWELHQMPIKASYCDSWYAACHTDYFCAGDSGDFFSCAGAATVIDEEARIMNKTWGAMSRGINRAEAFAQQELQGMLKALIAISTTLAALAIAFGCYLVRRERQGTPVFASPNAAEPRLMGAQRYVEFMEMS